MHGPLGRAWGVVSKGMGLSEHTQEDRNQPQGPSTPLRPTSPDDVQPNINGQGVKLDDGEAASIREDDMHLERQGLETQQYQPDSPIVATPPPLPQRVERPAAPNNQKERGYTERCMASESKKPMVTRKQEPSASVAEWQAERTHLLCQIEALEHAYGNQVSVNSQLNDRIKNQLAGFRRDYNELDHAKDAQQRRYEEYQIQLKAKVQAMEKEKCELQGQLAKMSEIISQLSKKGLPLPPDDNYLSQAFDSLVADTRQWARTFTKGQPPLTREALDAVPFSSEMISHLQKSFLDLGGLLGSTSVGSKVRTRCVETLLLQTLTSSYLTDRYIGFDHELYVKYQDILKSFVGSSEQEDQSWSALTNYLMTNNDDKFVARQNQEIDQVTNELYEQLLPLGGSSKRATKQSLRELVARVAKLGHLIAQLPFRIMGIAISPGTKSYEQALMEFIDGDMESGGGAESTQVTISLCMAWMKVTFDDKGDVMDDITAESYIYTKARVSCLT